MSFLDNIKREYESPEDNLAKDFIVKSDTSIGDVIDKIKAELA